MLKPFQDPNEMDMTLPEITPRLGIGERLLAEALASYLRTIRSGRLPCGSTSEPRAGPDRRRTVRPERIPCERQLRSLVT